MGDAFEEKEVLRASEHYLPHLAALIHVALEVVEEGWDALGFVEDESGLAAGEETAWIVFGLFA